MKGKRKTKRDVTINVEDDLKVIVPKQGRGKRGGDDAASLIARAIAKRGLRSAIRKQLRDSVAAYINEALGNAPKRRKRRKSKR